MTQTTMHLHNQGMRRLIAGGLLPERAGQPVKVWAHISLPELRAMDDGSVLQGEWISEMRVRWAARRAAAAEGGGDGAAWLDGDAARAVACDATVIPVVTGEVDPSLLDDLVDLCVQLAGHGCDGPGQPGDLPEEPGRAEDTADGDDQVAPGPLTPQAREMLQHAIIGKTTILLLHSRSAFELR